VGSGVEASEAESPELGLEFPVRESKGVVSESWTLGWFLGIPPLPGYCYW
jgi:hypothetical protein